MLPEAKAEHLDRVNELSSDLGEYVRARAAALGETQPALARFLDVLARGSRDPERVLLAALALHHALEMAHAEARRQA